MLSIPHVRRLHGTRHPRQRGGNDDELNDNGDSRKDTLALSTTRTTESRRRVRRLSKNCRNLARYGYDYAGFRRQGGVSQDERMEDALLLIQQQVMALERRRALMESVHLARYANARQIAANKIDEYYDHFCRGYDPVRYPARSRLLENIVRSVMIEDVESPAFPTIDAFLFQWANYSRFHAEIHVSVRSLDLLESELDDSESITIKVTGLTTFRISRDTIRYFFQPVMNDESLVQQLIGKEYCFPFVSMYHFNSTGRAFRVEPRADLAAGLFNLVNDPFSTVRLLQASQLSSDGCLHAYPEPEGEEALGRERQDGDSSCEAHGEPASERICEEDQADGVVQQAG
ncbi:hypothetical protein PINS_up010736 [Pythium insidiosum]|nr:hypothetical protein PINS_up010736 [Pythium insidiosum]